MKLTHRQVEFFKAIIEQGSITSAAAVLNVSQPAVSKALAILELEIGFPLFQRTQNGLIPTLEARAFYTEVDRSFSGLQYLSSVARDLTALKHGRLVVGVIPALSVRWLPIVIARFTKEFPEANLTFEAFSSTHMTQMVGQGRIDLGICQTSTNDPIVLRTPLFNIDVGVVLPPTHSLADKASIGPDDLPGQTLISLSRADVISRQLETLLVEIDKKVHRRVEVSLGSTLCRLAEEGAGIGLTDAETYHCCRGAGLTWRPFHPPIQMPIALLQSQRQPPSQMEREFIRGLRRLPPVLQVPS